MIKKVLLTFFGAFLTLSLFAAKAWKGILTVTQPDGTTLEIKLHGDEHCHYRTTTDGAIIVQKDGAYYLARIDEKGDSYPSTILAHNWDRRNNAEQLFVAQQNRIAFYNKINQTYTTVSPTREPVQQTVTTFPSIGSPKALVILAQFSDVKFRVNQPLKAFEQYLNAEMLEDLGNYNTNNNGSVKNYFRDMSHGKYTPQFDVYGPVTLNKTMADYGGNVNNKDKGDRVLIADAINAVKSQISDLKSYDSNKDGYIDLVYVIYAGYGENAGAPEDCLWPKSFSYSLDLGNGLRVGRCGISNELIAFEGAFDKSNDPTTLRINGIGLFCHEFSHCLGLPDFYPTVDLSKIDPVSGNRSYNDYDNLGMEQWSLMDYGCYARNGWCPAAYTAWEREALGWTTIPALTGNQPGVKLQALDNGGMAYRVYNDANEEKTEYYVVEFIQKSGWNAYAQASGMLLYHVDYNAGLFSLSQNAPNNQVGHPRMTVVPADGVLASSYRINEKVNGITQAQYREELAGDVFPGTANITTIDDNLSLVNFKPWVGERWNKTIKNLSLSAQKDGVSFDFAEFSTDINEVEYTDKDATSKAHQYFSITGVPMGTVRSSLPMGVYIINGKKVIIQ